MRKITTAFAVVSFLGVSSVPATAGGALLQLNQEFYVAGDVVHASSSVWLKSAMGRLEDGPYFAYLSEQTRRMPPPLPGEAARVAPVEIEQRPTGEHGDAFTEFVLPALDPGPYWLTICNDPCEITLGDLMPTTLLVVASEEEGRVAVMTDRLSERIRQVRIDLNDRVLGGRADSLRGRVTALERDVTHLLEELDELRESVDRRPAPPSGDRTSSLPQLLAFVLPAAVLGIVVARRPRRPA